MSGFLLDTNVVSMLAPSRALADVHFLDWLERQDASGQLFLSAVAVHEIERGIGLLEHKGASAKAAELRRWLAGLTATYDDKILPVTAEVAARSGALEAAAVVQGHSPGMSEALIAGTALAHGLTVVTQPPEFPDFRD
jgi:predicted nucleic acid-binding protein